MQHVQIYYIMTSVLGLIPLFFNLGATEVIIIAVVILLLFGGKKIPELMKGLGKGIKNFKEGMNEVTDEINKPVENKTQNQNKESEVPNK